MEKEAPTKLARHVASFTDFLEKVEKRILGLGLFPTDFSGEDEDGTGEEDGPDASLLPGNVPGNASGGDSSPPVQ